MNEQRFVFDSIEALTDFLALAAEKVPETVSVETAGFVIKAEAFVEDDE